jgi:outer membrane lipoprotein-sorting protein
MMTASRRLFIAVLLLGWVQAVSAQTVDEIVERHLTAIGGRAALAKLTSRSNTGTITLTTPVGDLTGPIEVLNQRPNKERTLITLDLSNLGAGNMTFDQRFDGKNGFVIDTLQGNRDITGDQLEAMKNEDFPTPLLSYKEKGIAVKLAGKEKVGDREAYVVLLEPKTGPAARQYIDAETYLLIRVVATAETPEAGKFEQTTDLLDYRDVDGFKVPFQVKATSTAQNFVVTLTKIEHNKTFDDSLFTKPAN